MKGIIAINAYAEPDTRQVRRMKEALCARGANITVVKNDMPRTYIRGGNIIASDPACDFCLYLDKDKYASNMLRRLGIRLFNTAEAIELCDDKMTTHIALADHGIAMPDTVAGPLCYSADSPVDPDFTAATENLIGYPVIVKLAYGSMGKGVFKADDRNALVKLQNELKLYPHLYQRYIKSSHGKDLRVIVVGGKVLGGIIRHGSDGDFRSNIGLGGHAEKCKVPDEVQNAAIKAADVLGLDYCGIDFLFGDSGFLLCEVNSNAYFDAFEAATGVDVAGEYAEHIMSVMKNI